MSEQSNETTPHHSPVFFSHEMMRGVPWVLVSRFVQIFMQFFIFVIIVKELGKEEFGLLTSTQALGEYLLVICGLGLNTALLRFAPELYAQRNRAGLIRLLVRMALLQVGMVLFMALVCWLLKPFIDEHYFKLDSKNLLALTMVLILIRLGRFLFEDTFTSLFRTGTVAALSFSQSVIWLLLTLFVLGYFPTAGMGITLQFTSVLIFPVVGFFLLIQIFRGIEWKPYPYGIGKRRVLNTGLASLLDQIALMFLRHYSVIFFLTIFFAPVVAGVYRLGCEMPLLAISFIPLSIQKLLTAGFAEAYSKDEHCLERLIRSVHRVLILAVLPISCFGIFFASRGIVLIFGEEYVEAGPVAGIFCFIHTLSIIHTPLSMAVVAKEKILNTVPLEILQVAVTLVLSFLLIPSFGMYGGIAVVFLTFVLTIPVNLYVVAKIVGGIYYPVKFLFRIAIPLMLFAAALYPLAPYLNVFTLFGLGFFYLAVYPFMIRILRLLKAEDVEELRAMEFSKINRLLDFLVR